MNMKGRCMVLLVVGFVSIFLLMGQEQIDPRSIVGVWHLVAASEPNDTIPDHRVDFRFDLAGDRLTGVVLLLSAGKEPLRELELTGSQLSFRLQSPSSKKLVLNKISINRFEGYWMKSENEKYGGPLLKLVRFNSLSIK